MRLRHVSEALPSTGPMVQATSIITQNPPERVRSMQAEKLRVRFRFGKWVGFAGEGGECSGDFVEVGGDVGGGCSGVVFAGVAGVGAGDGVTKVAFDPGEGGVSEPMGGDLLGGDPGEAYADALPEVVVAAGGDGVLVAVAEELLGGGAAALFVVVGEGVHEGGGDGLPAGGAAFLVEEDEALFGVEVAGS
jgi:hypothetical protein